MNSRKSILCKQLYLGVKNENQDYITVAKEDYEVLDKNK
jgi:hypothetical protein